MMDWARVVCVNVELDVLEIGGVVEHVEYQTNGENETLKLETETSRSPTSR